ncbi:MAG: DNA-processing protein DprA [Defluviitaleaceae bacterium]|nr:DNA-processing protein DprA [Defluviitaleaceae bacterium]
MEDTDKYILWLNNIQGITYKIFKHLMRHFKDTKNIYKSSYSSLAKTKIKEELINAILKSQSIELNYYVNILAEKNINFISILNENYPKDLKELDNPPLGIYIKGTDNIDKFINISIVGARKCSEYGILTTLRFSKYLAEKGINIISGMAKGIDYFAHKGALEANGITTAVLGSGINICYPKENIDIYNKINEKGIFISEYFLNTHPKPYFFPMRNRIISSISLATIVVEAGDRSGSLITADNALENGKDVFSVPGNITSKLSYGTNNLIKQGAYPITDPSEVLEILGIKETKVPEKIQKTQTKKVIDINLLASDEKLIYDCINFEPITIDYICNKLSKNLEQINYNLVILELKGLIKRLPGGRYVLS